MFRQRTKKGSDMSRMDKKEKKQMEMEQQAREEALEEELEAELPVQEAQPQEALPAAPTQEELDAAKAQAEEYLTLAQRVQADFDNFRRRNESVRADAYNEGIRSLAAVLLPVMDNLERAVDAAKDSPDAQLREGVGLVLRQLSEVFQKQGITPIDRLGEKFDPNLENALMQGTAEDGNGAVFDFFRRYRINSSGQIGFILSSVTDDYDFIQRFRVFGHLDIDRLLFVYFDRFLQISDIGKHKSDTRCGFDRRVSVDVGHRVSMPFRSDVYADERHTFLIGNLPYDCKSLVVFCTVSFG